MFWRYRDRIADASFDGRRSALSTLPIPTAAPNTRLYSVRRAPIVGVLTDSSWG